ncbi:tRNA pseudouridine(38-40) synthase TruA [Oecophyllibacter saccharovorans]|uniref:tRNA pseudouridine(38-40) synthase TruA n=1 Tax=Oecophyllibacter saccharovorans TaxID=2558360 RepID=UPI0011417D3D|nr:tRNA pseudouridine(38-40) synthase TruA [Oecophyllibacter saccharovorans]QDH15678.1 tRNA pseudouridine(38-40) synthase TruA [Oecophyllibacter saccharovorans]
MTDDPANQKTGQRWAVRIEFNGQPYRGWQRQENGLTVQQLVEEAAARLTRGRSVPSITAGRTDAGVHASGLVAHLDFPADVRLTAHTLREALNYHLKPHPVAILQAASVPADWNARFSAIWRRYRYVILNRPARPALAEGQVWHVRHEMDVAAMQEGARHLLGRHDFTSFRAAACQARHALRTLDELQIRRQGERILIETQARSFLHHQVRNMVGTLALVGLGRWTPAQVGTALAARDRRAAGPTAPADGLCLIGVGYPSDPFEVSAVS